MGNCFSSHSEAVRPVHSNIVSGNTALSSFATSNGKSETTSTPTTSGSSYSHVTSSFGSFADSFTQGSELPRFNSNSQGSAHKFTYSELKQATKNFKKDWRLGEGGFGTVFRGYIDEVTMAPCKPGQGVTVAVKKLNLEGLQGHREWLTEVYFLGGLSHPNLVKLIGYCADEVNRLLVYEFMTRGSLENHLFRKRNNTGLSWQLRMKVAVGAARGLAFLHDSQTRVIYRDFKASNILLDDDYNAKLSDFGLAKDGPQGDATHVSTRVMGTYGYAAPEYLATGHLSARSDVYSFGVVLLELLTGRRALDTTLPQGEQKLVEWARPFLNDKRRLLRIVDQRLDGQYSHKGAMRLAELASECLNEDSKARPTMKDILQVLEKLERPRIRSNNL